MANKKNKKITGLVIVEAIQENKKVTLKLNDNTIIIIEAKFDYDQMLGTEVYLKVDVI